MPHLHVTTIADRAGSSAVRILAILLVAGLTACGKPTASDHVARAQKFSAEKDYNSAVIEYRSALSLEPDTASTRWALGQLLLRTGNGAAAEKEIDAAMKLGLQDEAVTYAKARAMLLQQDAKNALILATERPPNAPSAAYHVLLGDIQSALQQFSEAAGVTPKRRDWIPSLRMPCLAWRGWPCTMAAPTRL